jgi:hypothetical protein
MSPRSLGLKFEICALPLALSLSTLLCASTWAREDLDQPMYRMPKPETQIVHQDFQEGLADIWLKALAQDRQELKKNAADALTRSHALGYKQATKASAALIREFQAEGQTPSVHTAIARALAELDAQGAQALFEAELETHSEQVSLAIEPALARWKSQVAINAWRKWIDDPSLDKTKTMRAIRGLVAVNDVESLGRFKQLIADPKRPITLRRSAARGIAELTQANLEEFVAPWLQPDTPMMERMLAATCLSTHESEAAIKALLQLGRDPEPTVALIACQRLADINIELLYDDLMTLSRNRDTALREIAIQGLEHRASQEDTRRLLELLADYHPDVRHNARVSLEKLADVETLRPIILDTAAEYLAKLRAADDWRALEQSAVLVGNLDHEPTADSLFELLLFDRNEVAVAAAWSLSRLSIPETFPRILTYITEITDKIDASDNSIDKLHEMQFTHFFQCFGLADHRPAKELLARYVPKRDFKLGMEGRAAAIWALGFIMNGDIDADLAQAITGRMLDGASSPAEVLVVRRMSAVALGRMNAEVHLPELQRTVDETGLAVDLGWCAQWSICQITGTAMPVIPDRTVYEQGWFLTPNKPRESSDTGE